MSFLNDRRGNLSIIRVSLLAIAIGVVVIIAGFIIYSFEAASYQSPLNVDAPASAVQWGDPENGPGARRVVYYQIPDMTPEDVANFYQGKLDEFNGDATDLIRPKCVRNPQTGVYGDYQEGNGKLPYWYTCVFDRSGFRTFQETDIRIEPGILHEDGTDTRGMTIVQYTQRWSS